jgi:hypothetical protein
MTLKNLNSSILSAFFHRLRLGLLLGLYFGFGSTKKEILIQDYFYLRFLISIIQCTPEAAARTTNAKHQSINTLATKQQRNPLQTTITTRN